MRSLRYTLLTDGSSDRALIAPITWSLREAVPNCAIQPVWADLRRLPTRPHGLVQKMIFAIDLYPCEILFVHRDAEREPPAVRVTEIRNALNESGGGATVSAVCVVPVRMTEAWFLLDEPALRSAAGNPNGRNALAMPQISTLEQIPDPKALLYDLLRQASGRSVRRLKRFRPAASANRLSELIDDFAPLGALPAFQAMQREIRAAIDHAEHATPD